MNRADYNLLIGAIAIAVANVERATSTDDTAKFRDVAMYGVTSVVNELIDVLDNALTLKETAALQYSADNFATETLLSNKTLDRPRDERIADVNKLRELAAKVNTNSVPLDKALEKTFTLFWRDGKRTVITGHTLTDAISLAGYGRTAMYALDFWANGNENGYRWDTDNRTWVNLAIEHNQG